MDEGLGAFGPGVKEPGFRIPEHPRAALQGEGCRVWLLGGLPFELVEPGRTNSWP